MACNTLIFFYQNKNKKIMSDLNMFCQTELIWFKDTLKAFNDLKSKQQKCIK